MHLPFSHANTALMSPHSINMKRPRTLHRRALRRALKWTVRASLTRMGSFLLERPCLTNLSALSTSGKRLVKAHVLSGPLHNTYPSLGSFRARRWAGSPLVQRNRHRSFHARCCSSSSLRPGTEVGTQPAGTRIRTEVELREGQRRQTDTVVEARSSRCRRRGSTKAAHLRPDPLQCDKHLHHTRPCRFASASSVRRRCWQSETRPCHVDCTAPLPTYRLTAGTLRFRGGRGPFRDPLHAVPDKNWRAHERQKTGVIQVCLLTGCPYTLSMPTWLARACFRPEQRLQLERAPLPGRSSPARRRKPHSRSPVDSALQSRQVCVEAGAPSCLEAEPEHSTGLQFFDNRASLPEHSLPSASAPQSPQENAAVRLLEVTYKLAAACRRQRDEVVRSSLQRTRREVRSARLRVPRAKGVGTCECLKQLTAYCLLYV